MSKIYKDSYRFIAVFHFADDGISISFPDLPGCLPCADTEEEALKNARESLGLHLWGLEQDGEPIPAPSSLKNVKLDAGDIPAVIEVYMPPVREKLNNRAVKKTVTIPAWMAARADEAGVNYSGELQNALMKYFGEARPN
ncbi:MAG: type II toxin-antitoxin system HicB family antitoxin [Acutalibacteraceae bacterium]